MTLTLYRSSTFSDFRAFRAHYLVYTYRARARTHMNAVTSLSVRMPRDVGNIRVFRDGRVCDE